LETAEKHVPSSWNSKMNVPEAIVVHCRAVWRVLLFEPYRPSAVFARQLLKPL
jgi:hypothetical protein